MAEAEPEYPILIFSHGFGGLPELDTVKAEELASHGYVVVAINHTYDSLINILPDGRVISSSPIFQAANEPEFIELIGQSATIRAEDAQFVLDELEKIDAGNDPTGLFVQKLDLDRVGVYGHSLGGLTAAKALSIDSRFQAGINLDGGLYGDVVDASLSQPFMFVNAEAFGTGNSSDPEIRQLNQLQQSFVNNLQNDGYEVTILGAEHLDFTDLPLLTPILVNSGIELGDLGEFGSIAPEQAAQIINDYTVAFFEQHLNQEESPLLTSTSSPYPDVIFQSYPEENIGGGQEAPDDLAQTLQATLEQTARDTNVPDIGVAIGVVTPEGTWTGATGVSNLDTQQATQPDDLFNIASISKSLTAATILKLQEQGKLSLDDTLDQWLPEIAANLTNGENLTIRQLLNGAMGRGVGLCS